MFRHKMVAIEEKLHSGLLVFRDWIVQWTELLTIKVLSSMVAGGN